MASAQRKFFHKPKRKKRNIYILSRPLTAASHLNLSFLSDGKLPLCHWGVLVSDYDRIELQRHLQLLRDDPDHCRSSLGTLIELRRTETNVNTINVIKEFGEMEMSDEWHVMGVKYIGTTSYPIRGLRNRARKITEERPDYDAYTNNCQNFAQYLLSYACPGSKVPKTIKETVEMRELRNAVFRSPGMGIGGWILMPVERGAAAIQSRSVCVVLFW